MLRVDVKPLHSCSMSFEREGRRADRPPSSGPRKRRLTLVRFAERGHARSVERANIRSPSPSIRARICRRGPLRPASLEPNSRCGTLFVPIAVAGSVTNRTRSTRVPMASAPVRLRHLQDGAGRHDARRRITPEGNKQLAREGDDADLPRPCAAVEALAIPLAQGTRGLPLQPAPR